MARWVSHQRIWNRTVFFFNVVKTRISHGPTHHKIIGGMVTIPLMAGLWRCFNHNRHVSTTWFPPIALAYPLQPPGQASERLLFLGSLWSPQITLNPPSPATSILQPEGLHKHHQAWKTVRRLTPFFFCVKAFFCGQYSVTERYGSPHSHCGLCLKTYVKTEQSKHVTPQCNEFRSIKCGLHLTIANLMVTIWLHNKTYPVVSWFITYCCET